MSNFQRTADFWNSRQANAPQITEQGTVEYPQERQRGPIEQDAEKRGKSGRYQLKAAISPLQDHQVQPDVDFNTKDKDYSKLNYGGKAHKATSYEINNAIPRVPFGKPKRITQLLGHVAGESGSNKIYDLLKSLMVGSLPFIIVFTIFLLLRIFIGSGAKEGNYSLQKSALSLTNMFKVLIFLSSFITIFMILFFAIILNRYTQGVIFICGILTVLLLNYILKKIFSDYQNKSLAGLYCNILPPPFTVSDGYGIKSAPSTNITLLTFICMYIFSSILDNKDIYNFNYFIIIFLLIIFVIVAVTEYFEGCSSKISILLAVLTGLIYGFFYKGAVWIMDNRMKTKHGKTKMYAGDLFNLSENNPICKADKISNSYGTTGFKWEKIESTIPLGSIEIFNPFLFRALSNGKVNFTRSEWKGFGIDNISTDHIVRAVKGSNIGYFKPEADKLIPNENTKYFKCVTKTRNFDTYNNIDLDFENSGRDYPFKDVLLPDNYRKWKGKINVRYKKINDPSYKNDQQDLTVTIYGINEEQNTGKYTLKEKITVSKKIPIIDESSGLSSNSLQEITFMNIMGYSVYGIYFNLPDTDKNNVEIHDFKILPKEISKNVTPTSISKIITNGYSDFANNNDKNRLYIIKPNLKEIYRNTQINISFLLKHKQ